MNFVDPSGLEGEIIRIPSQPTPRPGINIVCRTEMTYAGPIEYCGGQPVSGPPFIPNIPNIPPPPQLPPGTDPPVTDPPQQNPPPAIPTIEAAREIVKRNCLASKKAEADKARAQYIANAGGRMLRGMAVGAGLGAARGAYAGGVGGAFGAGVGAVPGAIGGGIIGGILGASSSVITGGLIREPAQRAFYDRTTYQPALDRAAIECDIEAGRVR